MPIIQNKQSNDKTLPIKQRLQIAERERENVKSKYAGLKGYNKLLVEENEELALENYYTERCNASLLEENTGLREDVNRIHRSKYAVPCAIGATMAALALGAYIAITDTPLLDHMNKWFDQKPRPRVELNSSRR